MFDCMTDVCFLLELPASGDCCLTVCFKDGLPLPPLSSDPQKMCPKTQGCDSKCRGGGQLRFVGQGCTAASDRAEVAAGGAETK